MNEYSVGPAIGDVLEAGEQLHALQCRPSGVLRINAARISVDMVLQPLLAGFRPRSSAA